MCGLFAVVGHPDAARLTYLGLYALQHRGQESAGIITVDDRGKLHQRIGVGHIYDVFDERTLGQLPPGSIAVGHVRYSTARAKTFEKESRDSALKNAQPLLVTTRLGELGVALNGDLVEQSRLRRQLEHDGAIFYSDTDTEILPHLIARSREETFEAALIDALESLSAAYCFLVVRPDAVYVARDRLGFRPLVLGQTDGAYVLASETCALELINAKYLRNVEPGEVLKLRPGTLQTVHQLRRTVGLAFCAFEWVYFSRPDSMVFGKSIGGRRRQLGRLLAREHPAPNADIVVPVPDSGMAAAHGYAEESGLPLEESGFIRNHYVGRTFIEPQQGIRDFGVKVKLNPVREWLAGKRVVLVDDSIVRGTTMRKIVRLLRSAGAVVVHVRISCPPTKWPCKYGIDTPTRSELIAATKTEAEICKYLEADSLGYLSLDGLETAILEPLFRNGQDAVTGDNHLCLACWDGVYPVPIPHDPQTTFFV